MPKARHRPVTLSDIAAGCGVSRATVSLVLRQSPLVNAQTRSRVEAEIKRVGYVYNRAAASLRTRRSSSVALVVNDLSNPFFAEFAAGVDEALAAAYHELELRLVVHGRQPGALASERLVNPKDFVRDLGGLGCIDHRAG